MKTHVRRLAGLSVFLLAVIALAMAVGYAQTHGQEKVSAPGQYSGYSSPDYPSHTTTS